LSTFSKFTGNLVFTGVPEIKIHFASKNQAFTGFSKFKIHFANKNQAFTGLSKFKKLITHQKLDIYWNL
jgi:DNA-binding MurR/RpiR family transcriptional regulator